MKKLLLLSVLLLPACLLAKSPQPQVQEAPLPSGVSSVSPAQGFVEVSGPAFPKGVSNIGVTFSNDIIVNEANTTPALLYFNDFTTPAAKTLAVGVDMETLKTGSVLFKSTTWNKTGIYKIEIPEGYWLYDGSNNPTPAITLYYEIYIGYNVVPTPGVVPELDLVVLTFWEADKVERTPNSSSTISFYQDNSDQVYSVHYTIMDYNGDGKENEVVFNVGDFNGIAQTFRQTGIFGLMIDSGAFTYYVYGPNYANDPEDYVVRKNDDLLLKYNIPNIPMPEIDPPTDEILEYFDYFTLWMPERFTKWFTNDKTSCNIFAVNDNGIVDTNTSLCRVRFVWDNNMEDEENVYADKIVLNLFDVETNEPLDKFMPPSGFYCLKLADGLFSGMYQSLLDGASPEFVNSSPFDYYYEISNSVGVEDIKAVEAAAESYDIYTLTGLRVARNADASVLSTLKPGLYIINGKKIMKK